MCCDADTTSIGNLDASDTILHDCLLHCRQPEDKANLLRQRSHNRWLQGRYTDALNDTLSALRVLGVAVDPEPSQRQVNAMFEEVRNEIMAVGFDNILTIPRTSDSRMELAVSLLNDAGLCCSLPRLHLSGLMWLTGINAYWSPSPYYFADLIGLTVSRA